MLELEVEREMMAITAPLTTAASQAQLRAGGIPDHFTMHSFGVGGSLSMSLAGTVVDEITKIRG